MERVTGFRSYDALGYERLTEELQEDSQDFITHTDQGVWAKVAMFLDTSEPETENEYPGGSSEISLSIGFEDTGRFRVALEPNVARNVATMLLRAADVIDQMRVE